MRKLPQSFPRKLRRLASKRDEWIKRNAFYHREVTRALSFFIPVNSSVLQIGSGTGYLLNSLGPGRGVGIDLSPQMVEIAKRNYPHLEFRHQPGQLRLPARLGID